MGKVAAAQQNLQDFPPLGNEKSPPAQPLGVANTAVVGQPGIFRVFNRRDLHRVSLPGVDSRVR